MSGRYLLDTNAIIYAINRSLVLPAGIYAVSVITKLELFCWPSITPEDEEKLEGCFMASLLFSLKALFRMRQSRFAKMGH